MVAIIIALVTVFGSSVCVLTKPYVSLGRIKIGLYWLICLFGAILMLLFGNLPLSFVVEKITASSSVNPIKILVLFICMTLLSIYLGDAGFFYLVADKVFSRNKNSALKLFFMLYLVVGILTIFTSNDIIILTLTPPICIFCKRAKISPIPFLLGEFVSANTWSTMLIIGNPTNIYLAQSMGISFAQYLSFMWLPSLICGFTSLGVLFLIFRKSLTKPLTPSHSSKGTAIDKPRMIVAICHLAVCLVMLAICDVIGIEMWLVCLSLALSLTVFNLVFGIIKERSALRVALALKKAPYELIPFVLSMFVIVCGLNHCGFTKTLSSILYTNTKFDGLIFGLASGFSANLLNNIPMSVLFSSIVKGGASASLFGSIIGSNVGAFITPVGALAGIMWTKILSEYEIRLPFYKFLSYGVCVAIPTIITSCLSLTLIF